MRLGVHIPIAGGFSKALERAERLGCTTMQIFSRSPRGGKAEPIAHDLADAFDRARRQADIDPLAIHAPYVMNLASPEEPMWSRSLQLYQDEYERATLLNAQYLVTHVGSHKGSGEAAGIQRVCEAMNRTLARCESHTMILLENTAGAGDGLGDQFEQLAAMRHGVTDHRRVGICLDTAHLFAAGFPIHTVDGLEQVVTTFDRVVGLEHLRLVHLNDSKVAFGTRVDRHWHIGQGQIGLEPFRRLVTHPQLRHLPFILETPKSTETDDQRNLSTVRQFVSDAPTPRQRTRHIVPS